MTKNGPFATRLPSLIGALGFMGVWSLPALADYAHSHVTPAPSEELTPDQKWRGSELLPVVRDATRRFQDVSEAESEGCGRLFGCVSGESEGAMGLHYVNQKVLNQGNVDATRPQIVIYEPMPGGRLRRIGEDYLVFKDGWDAHHQLPRN